MKASFLILSPLLLVASCKKEVAPVATVPVVVPEIHDNALRPDGTVRQEVKVSDVPVAPAPAAIPVPDDLSPTVDVDEEEPSPRTPGEHLDRALQKTDEGIRKGADATGRFLQRAGEKIEDEAHRNQRPPGQ